MKEATEYACPDCKKEVEGMALFGAGFDTPDSFNDLEHGEEYYFCDSCFQEFVDMEWYREHY